MQLEQFPTAKEPGFTFHGVFPRAIKNSARIQSISRVGTPAPCIHQGAIEECIPIEGGKRIVRSAQFENSPIERHCRAVLSLIQNIRKDEGHIVKDLSVRDSTLKLFFGEATTASRFFQLLQFSLNGCHELLDVLGPLRRFTR